MKRSQPSFEGLVGRKSPWGAGAGRGGVEGGGCTQGSRIEQ